MNKYLPHVYVLPEDDADRQVANGFVDHPRVEQRRIQVLPPAGGWPNVLKTFQDEYVQALRRFPQGHLVLLIDFDDRGQTRRDLFEREIPDDLKTRVFVVGAQSNPELLRNTLNLPFEQIGTTLADECATGVSGLWTHEQLRHNEDDRRRMVQTLKPILF